MKENKKEGKKEKKKGEEKKEGRVEETRKRGGEGRGGGGRGGEGEIGRLGREIERDRKSHEDAFSSRYGNPSFGPVLSRATPRIEGSWARNRFLFARRA